MKILIIGTARHGKDSLGEIFRDAFGKTFISSSEMANDLFIYDKLKNKYNYKSKKECYDDRYQYRDEWYDLIVAYNTPDKTRLARDIVEKYDIYVGMRDDEEFYMCQEAGIFDLVIWVDGSDRLDNIEPSNKLYKTDADIIIENNHTLEDFKIKALALGKAIFL